MISPEKRDLVREKIDRLNIFCGKGHRVAYHDNKDGSDSDVYFSNHQGDAMHTVSPEDLTEEEFHHLLGRFLD